MKIFSETERFLAGIITLCLAGILNFPSQAAGQAHFELGYTGRVVSKNGQPFAGPVKIEINFFFSETGNDRAPIDPIVLDKIPLSQGVFQVKIPLSVSDFQIVFPSAQSRAFLQISDLTNGNIFKRQALLASANALQVPVEAKQFKFNTDGKLTINPAPVPGKFLKADTDGSLIWDNASGAGLGDMQAAVYDTNANLVVDQAENAGNLNSQPASFYQDASNLNSGTVNIGRLPVGAAAGTVAAGNDSRFTDSRSPSGSAGGDLTGTYPDPQLSATGVTAGTWTKLTVDAKGRITNGSTLAPIDLPVATGVTAGAIKATAGKLSVDGTGVITAITADSALSATSFSGSLAGDVTGTQGATVISDGAISGGTGGKIADNTITNADISASAAIADTKLAAISTPGKVTGNAITSGTIGGSVSVDTSGAIASSGNFVAKSAGEVRFSDSDNSNYLALKSPASVAANVVWTLPPSDGSGGQVLSTNGAGMLSWASPAGGGNMLKTTYDTDDNGIVDSADALGGQLPSFYTNASNISSGTLAAARVPNLDASKITTGTLSDSVIPALIARDSEIPANTDSLVEGTTNKYFSNTLARGAISASAPLSYTPATGVMSLGTVGVSLGGTGQSSFTSNAVILGNSSGALNSTAAGSPNQVLRVPGAGGAPSFGAVDLSQSSAVTGTLQIANGGTGATSASANFIFAAPNGSSGAPAFRALAAADYPAMIGANGVTAGTRGAVPQPASTDNTKYLRGDGTWATPAGGGGAAGATGQIQFNNAGAHAASANLSWDDTNKRLAVSGQYVGALQQGSIATINWDDGNTQSTSAAPGTLTFTTGKMLPGATYTLVLTDGSGGNYTLSSADIVTWRCKPACPGGLISTITSSHTMLTIVRVGTTGYVAWISGF